jgi:ATP-dependent protease ClpP protease subunit
MWGVNFRFERYKASRVRLGCGYICRPTVKYIGARLLILLAIWFSWPSLAAEITAASSCEREESVGGSGPFADLIRDCGIHFTGRIDPGDADRSRAIVEKLKALPRHSQGFVAQINLSSPGGEVGEAMKIGRIIRENTLRTLVGNAVCVSACVLVLASGVERIVTSGQIGIHSPYSESLPVGEKYERTRQRREILNKSIRDYFREMDIPEALLTAMNRVPSDKIRWLQQRELRDLHLIGEDTAWREWKAANEARKLGISLSEFVARSARVRSICQLGPAFSACKERVLRGN